MLPHIGILSLNLQLLLIPLKSKECLKGWICWIKFLKKKNGKCKNLKLILGHLMSGKRKRKGILKKKMILKQKYLKVFMLKLRFLNRPNSRMGIKYQIQHRKCLWKWIMIFQENKRPRKLLKCRKTLYKLLNNIKKWLYTKRVVLQMWPMCI